MGLFGGDRRHKPRGFDYIPRYYDAEKEERENRLRQYKNEGNKDVSAEEIKERIKLGLKTKAAYKPGISRKAGIQSNVRVVIIIAFLSIIAYLFLRTESTVNVIQGIGG